MCLSVLRVSVLSCIVVGMTACGGSGGGSAEDEIDDSVVSPESCNTDPASSQCQNESQVDNDGQNDGQNEGDTDGDQIPEIIAIGASSQGTVAAGESHIFKVPADTQVTLTSQTGDADLYLYSSDEFTADTLLCSDNRPFDEDNCTASDADGELYAEVYGRELSTYNISVSADCSVQAVNEWVYRNMKDYYLYADSVPAVNPASYVTTTELIRDLRFEEFDPYSSVGDVGRQQAFFDEGVSFGFGFSLNRDAQGNLRVLYTFDDAPFGRAGIKRGDILLGLNNELWDEMSNDRYFELVGTEENPLPNSWQFIDGESGLPKSVTLTQAEYRLNTVLYTASYTNPAFDGKTGYIVFKEFIRSSEAELDRAINSLIDSGATELVLDLRYNPGGYTYIARKLASQIGGADLEGNVLVRYEYNDKYTSESYQRDFVEENPVLDFDRVVVLTTDRSASSSELLINALKPYIDVVVIGEKTEGKAFISVSNQYCGKALNAMEAQGVNANGDSVAGGITPNCYASDDPTRNFGGSGLDIEGMLTSALDYIEYGICEAAPVLTKKPDYDNTRINERPPVGALVQ